MPKNSKYSALTRSSVIAAIAKVELELEHCRAGSDKDRTLRKERADLFDALREKDAALLAKWNDPARIGN